MHNLGRQWTCAAAPVIGMLSGCGCGRAMVRRALWECVEREEEKGVDMGVRIEKLCVSFGKMRVLHEMSMEIGDGEFVSLLGASGCGKSTLLKSIAGLLETESGRIEIDGKVMDNVAPEKRGTVIVFQDLRLFPHMTAGKNIAFPMSIKKVPKELQRKTVERLLTQVQLEGYGNRKIREMSGGQMQRVALARALAAKPGLLLLDEPFSGLDERLRMEMGELVRKLHRENGLTTVLVTHDKQEALKFSDRIALMSGGRILQYDTPQKIYRHPACREVAEYFGRMNYIREGDREIGVRPFDVRILPSGNDCTVEEIVFMGETAEVRLGTPQGAVYCLVMSRELDGMGIEAGMRVGMEIAF